MKKAFDANPSPNKIVRSLCGTLAFVLCIMLCGCTTNDDSTETHLETRPYITEQQVNSVENLTIYVFNEETSRLESRIVQVTIYPDQTKADAALSYLLTMPEFEFALNSYGVPDYTLTIAGGIARVHITNDHLHVGDNHYKCFALHFSIVNTLCSINGINYASVYAGSSEMAGDVYIGPSRFLETSINDHYIEYNGTGNSVSSQHPMLLYFGEKGQAYIVPEPHQVYTNINDHTKTINAVLEKMSSSPTNSSDLIAPVANDVVVSSVVTEGQAMTVDFNKEPCPTTISNQSLTYAALYNTITAIYPDIKELIFTVEGMPVNINGNITSQITKDTFPEIIGSAVTLYMAQSSMDSLYPVNKYLSASSGISVTHIMEALAAGPIGYENTAITSPVLGGLTMDNIINARVVNDVAILNFDTSFYDSVKGMSKAEETIMVYGIVNTLTAREQISCVQFLINNQSFDTINGHIYYSQPLFSNPGLSITQ